jgi:4-hydroxyphenylacetate 3-monooxygenase
MGSPFDYPLSSRLDENDAILILDKVLIPWEDLFVYRDVEKANAFFPGSGFIPRFTLHGCTRFAVKLDFLSGLLLKALEAVGGQDSRSAQVHLGEVLAWRNTFWGLTDAMTKTPEPWVSGAVQPNTEYGLAYRTLAATAYPRIKEIIEQTISSGLIYLNSHAVDFKTPELRPYLDKYLRGSNNYDALERVKMLKLLWDAQLVRSLADATNCMSEITPAIMKTFGLRTCPPLWPVGGSKSSKRLSKTAWQTTT